MYPDASRMMHLLLSVALVASSEAFFFMRGSDSAVQSTSQKAWAQSLPPSISPNYPYQYMYNPYDARKLYQIQPAQYQQPEMQPMQPNLAPIPISVPAGASLKPVSLQHVQLVPCMCPVAPEEADKLQEQAGQGPYVAQTYATSYTVPQQGTMNENKQQ